MTIELIKFAFVAGELTPRLFGRTDLEQYELGLAKGENWFVDYRGGLSTRAGQEFVDFVWKDDKPTKFVPFRFSTEIANIYIVLFGDLYVRFIQDGAYVLEEPKTITAISNANPGQITASNNFAVGDWVKVQGVTGMQQINNDIVQVLARTATTVTMGTIDGTSYDTSQLGTYTGGGTVSRIYTVASPYLADDLATLQAHQLRDTLRLTHQGYPIHNLKRNDHDDWDLVEEDIGTSIGRPSGLTLDPLSEGGYWVGYQVTAVNEDEEESLPTDMKITLTNRLNEASAPGSVTLKWNPVNKARYYKVYKTNQIARNSGFSRSQPVGYVARPLGSTYIDDGIIIPDFTLTPPSRINPFADGGIEYVRVLTEGSGYAWDCALSVSDPNPDAGGFIGYPIIESTGTSNSGPIGGVLVVNPGHDYTNPVFTVTAAGGGSGATFEAELSEPTGNNPVTSAIFQQRQIYAGTENYPLKLWGSKPGLFSNFDTAQILLEDDSYEFEVDSEDVAHIRHMIQTRGGLLLMSSTGIWQLGGTGNNSVVTPNNAMAEPHAYNGVAALVPARIESDIMYLTAKNTVVKLLTYDDVKKVYGGADLSVTASHLITALKPITAWSYADEPFKLVWARRSDGSALSFMFHKEHKVAAWTPIVTRGMYEDVIAIEEHGVDRVYFMVSRNLDGKIRKYIERQTQRAFDNAEDYVCLDCALSLPGTYPNRRLQVEKATGIRVKAETFNDFFTAADVGKVIRSGGGKMNVVEYVGARTVLVDIVQPITEVIPGTDVPKIAALETWSIDMPVSSVSGFNQFRGQKISVLADGNFLPNVQVSATGSITLPQPATRVAGGLGYRCVARTLPMTAQPSNTIEGRRKRVVGLALRMIESRGLLVGTREDNVYPMKDRTEELWGEPTKLFNGMKYMGVEPVWDEDAQVFFVQEDPLPVSILGYVVDGDIGDEDRD